MYTLQKNSTIRTEPDPCFYFQIQTNDQTNTPTDIIIMKIITVGRQKK